MSVLDEFLAMRAASPGVEFARPVLPALVRPPENGEPADLISDPKSAAVADLGNVAYEVLLQLLYRLLSRVDENDEQMKILSEVAVGLMSDVIEPLGEILTTLPVGPEHPGRTAGPPDRRAELRALLPARLPAPAPNRGLAHHGGAPRRRG